jgi:hypothetical protein
VGLDRIGAEWVDGSSNRRCEVVKVAHMGQEVWSQTANVSEHVVRKWLMRGISVKGARVPPIGVLLERC